MKRSILVFVLFLSASASAWADTVYFESGYVVHGVTVRDARQTTGALVLIQTTKTTTPPLAAGWYSGTAHIEFGKAKAPGVLPFESPHKPIAATIKRAVDGDTLELTSGTKVRLIGVDTPETVDPRKPVERFGREASAFTKAAATGKRVWIEFDQQKVDRYGRLLGYVFLLDGGLFLNEAIIARGYGHAYVKYPFRQDYMQRFMAAERKAREARIGLWGDVSKLSPATAPSMSTPVPKSNQNKATTVYITRTGKKYHRSGCQYLRSSRIAISLLSDHAGRGLRQARRARGV